MKTKEELLKELEKLEEDLELEKSFNANSGELSFIGYQIQEVKEELKKLENE